MPQDERRRTDASDEARGTGGRRGWVRPFWLIAILIVLMNSANVFSVISDGARQGRTMPAWHPVLWEVSSGVGTLVACWLVRWAVIVARPGEVSWKRALVVHGGASITFSFAHVGMMVVLRIAIHALAGEHYHFERWEWLYEYRKDAVSYVILASIFWYFTGRTDAAADPHTAPPPTKEAEIAVPQGGGFINMPVARLSTVKACGNYVEYGLEGGRTLLVRASLHGTAAELNGLGFVRTHRSWLVNKRTVSEVRPIGGGNFEVHLQDGRTIPLARRYRSTALDKLRLA